MRIAIVTDAWHPQVNGVVRTLDTTREHLTRLNHTVQMITPATFRTVPCPTYPSIRLALWPGPQVQRILRDFAPNAIHIATEGPLGHAARRYCLTNHLPFTTSFHTQFPEYLRLRAPVPIAWTYPYIRRFHQPAVRTLVPTQTQLAKLASRGFQHLCRWARGVDLEIFNPTEPVQLPLPRPIAIYMGRVAVEKNIEAFLARNEVPSKVVIGDGPALAPLRERYPECHFLGPKYGRELARHLAAGDVFVFPSRTDTFGLVLLEAMACGLPVAAFPVQGPLDVVRQEITGILDEDLGRAIQGALKLSRTACIADAERYSWAASTADFASFLAPINWLDRRDNVPPPERLRSTLSK